MKRYLKRPLSVRDIIQPLRIDTGFTVLEMVMAMAVLSILTTIAGWGIYLILPDILLRSAVRNLKSDMHLARLTAIRHHMYVVSEFNTANNSYTIYRDGGGEEDANANNYSQDAGEPTIKFVRLHSRLNMFRAQFGSTVGKFAFNSRGTLDGLAGGIYMHNQRDKYRGVTISRIGKITIKNDV